MTNTQAANLKKAFAEHDIPWPTGRSLFWHPAGPLIRLSGGVLYISDLDPETHMQWRMSRKEMFQLGWRCILAAVRR